VKITTGLLLLSMIWWGISFARYQNQLNQQDAQLKPYLESSLIEAKAYQDKHWALYKKNGKPWGQLQTLYIAGQEDAFQVSFTLHTLWQQNPLLLKGSFSLQAGSDGDITQAQLYLQSDPPLGHALSSKLRLQLFPSDTHTWRLQVFLPQAYTHDIPLKAHIKFLNPVFPFNRIYIHPFKSQLDIPDRIPFHLKTGTPAEILYITDLNEEKVIAGVSCKRYQIHLKQYKSWPVTFWLSREGELMEIFVRNPLQLRQISQQAPLSLEPFNLDPLMLQGMSQLALWTQSSSGKKGFLWPPFFTSTESK